MFHNLKLAAALLLLAIAILITGVVTPISAGSVFMHAIQNAAHPIGFAALGGFLVIMLANVSTARQSVLGVLVVGATLLAAALGTEALQIPLPHRSATLEDVIADLLGGVGGAAVIWLFRTPWKWQRLAALATATLCLGLALAPYRHISMMWLAQPDLPTLIDASAPLGRWHAMPNRGAIVVLDDDASDPSLLVRLDGGRWPGARVVDPEPDWSDCTSLVLDARGHQGPVQLWLRIADNRHQPGSPSRYRSRITLSAEKTRYRFSLADIRSMGGEAEDRELDTSAIADVLLYTHADQIGRAFHIHHLALDGCAS